jgi:prolyl oligopeptidase
MVPVKGSAQIARRGPDTSVYHKISVEDPYRWMEDTRSAETREWIKGQDNAARAFAAAWPGRDSALASITAGNVPLMARVPIKEGGRYFITRTRNTGPTQTFSLVVQDSRTAKPRPVIDADEVFARDSTRVRRVFVGPDGRTVAYAVARGGSQNETIRIRDIDTGKDLLDHVDGVQATAQVVWARRGTPAFFYIRYTTADRVDGIRRDPPRLMLHRLGTDQSSDSVVFERPDHPEWVLTPQITDDGRYLLIFARVGIERRDRVYYRDLTDNRSRVIPLTEEADAELTFIGSSGHELWFLTDYRAPRRRIVSVDVHAPQRSNWRELIPETSDVIDTWTNPARAVGDKIIVLYRANAALVPRVFDSAGRFLYELPMPGKFKSIWSLGGRQTDSEAFYAVQDVVEPNTVFSLDTRTGKSVVFDRPSLPYDPAEFVTEQVFYTSEDGTRVPMFVMHAKHTKLDGTAPGLLYGYGFDAWIGSPWWQPMVREFMRRGGVWALANVRGGGEYGSEWAAAGRRRNKQTSIDDYLAAAEWLQKSRYVARGKLIANSSSAGGMLAAAAIQQRPNLFAAAILDYPVIDMFRYHLFRGGARWTQEYGTVADSADFTALRAYSPLHRVQSGTCYPPVMLSPGELDQVATPMHAYKFAAALQFANAHTPGCTSPVLLRVSWGAGHQAGATPRESNENWADQIAFIFRVIAGDGSTLGISPSRRDPDDFNISKQQLGTRSGGNSAWKVHAAIPSRR